MKRKYICTVDNDSLAYPREFEVETSSALKAARDHGYGEDSDVICIYTKSGELISKAMWDIENKKYYRCFTGVHYETL